MLSSSSTHLAHEQLLGRDAHNGTVPSLWRVSKLDYHGLGAAQVLRVVLALHGQLRLGPGVEHDHGAALAAPVRPAHHLAGPQLAVLAEQRLHIRGGDLEGQLAREHLGLRHRQEEGGEEGVREARRHVTKQGYCRPSLALFPAQEPAAAQPDEESRPHLWAHGRGSIHSRNFRLQTQAHRVHTQKRNF